MSSLKTRFSEVKTMAARVRPRLSTDTLTRVDHGGTSARAKPQRTTPQSQTAPLARWA